MPKWLFVCATGEGEAFTAGFNAYFGIMGELIDQLNENRTQYTARDAYTWANLYVRVITNLCANPSTIRSRKNAAFGNQIVTVAAGATGVFEDVVNSDAVVVGNLINWQSTTGAGGNVTYTVTSCTLETAINNTPLLGGQINLAEVWDATGCPQYMAHIYTDSWAIFTEAHACILARVAATSSNLKVMVSANILSTNTTLRQRINGAYGNQIVNIPGAATGSFEDAVNSDAINVGDLICIRNDGGADGGDFATGRYLFNKSTSAGRWLGSGMNSLAGAPGDTFYALEGYSSTVAVEANVQTKALTPFTLRNMMIYIDANTATNTCRTRIRKNGANSALVIAVGAGLTGRFEDIVNSEAFVAADLLNWRTTFDVPNPGEGFDHSVMSVQLDQPGGPPAPAPAGGSPASKLIAAGVI